MSLATKPGVTSSRSLTALKSAFARHHSPLSSTSSPNPVWSIARPWQTNAALALIGILLFVMSHQLVSEYDHFTIGFSVVSSFSAILYIAAVLLVLTQPVNRYTLPLILTIALACRLATLFADPYLSTDIYRYVWDGVVQHAHISPYRYVPGNPALTFLRAPNQDIFDNINRRDYAHTIYPPFAQIIFYLVTFISPTVTCMKTAMILFEGVTIYALIQLLTLLNLRREQVLLYAWCPLLIWEIAGSGHLDAAAMAFISLALLARYRRQPILTGLFLALAVLTKLYPIVLLPALLLPRRLSAQPLIDARAPQPPQQPAKSGFFQFLPDWKMPVTCLSLIALGYAAYSSVGLLVFGFLGGYAKEEGIETGTRYFFLDLAHHLPGLHNLPATAFYLLCLLVFGALTLWAIQAATQPSPLPSRSSPQTPRFLAPAFALAAALMFLFSPHYPWYIVWLIPFFTLLPNLTILTYLMAFFYLFTTALADGSLDKMYLVNKILYGAVLLAFVVQVALRKRALPGLNFHQAPSEPQRPA
jgi:hypothetical protein